MTTSDYAQPAVPLPNGSMPLLGFGTWQISDADAEGAVTEALDLGYRHLDTATMYQNEAGIGRALSATDLNRDDLFVTTKFPPERAGRERATIEDSLSKLGLDYVDLWLIHAPPSGGDAVDMWQEFVSAQGDGLVRDVGVSNFSVAQIDELVKTTGVTPAVNQIRWTPAIYEQEVAQGHAERNVVLEGYSPFKAANLDDPTLTKIAEAHDATAAQVIVAWHVAHRFVVIPKSSKRERMEANAAGARIELSDDEIAAIDALGK